MGGGVIGGGKGSKTYFGQGAGPPCEARQERAVPDSKKQLEALCAFEGFGQELVDFWSFPCQTYSHDHSQIAVALNRRAKPPGTSQKVDV